MQNPDWLEQILDSFDVRIDPFMEASLADALSAERRKHGDHIDNASRSAFLAEHSAFMFLENPDKDSLWGTYFGPMAEWNSTDESRIVLPDVAQLTEVTVQHWAERAQMVQHPMMRARYADCIWDLERVIVVNSKRQPNFAVLAAQSYIEVAKRNGIADEVTSGAAASPAQRITGVRMLARAVRLARSIKSSNLASEAAAELISFCERHGEPAHAGIWLAPFDTLYGEKNLLTSEQRDRIISSLEAMLQRTSSAENGKDPNCFGAQEAAERLIRHYNDLAQTQRLVQTYGSCFERMARDASPMLAMAWLQPVVEKYQQVGLKPESERLANIAAEKGRNIGEDLKNYSVEVTIESELLEKRTEALLAGNELGQKLHRIGLVFTPRTTEVKKSLNLASKNAPLLSRIGQSIVNSDGQTIAHIGPLNKDVERRLQKQTADHIGILQPCLSHALSELKRRDKPTAEQILEVLYECPLFSEKRRSLIQEGIAAYLAEDWVKAIHILVPQAEAILRNLLAGMEIPITKTVKSNPGVTELKNMGDVLREERIRSVLGEDKWRYFSALYTDREGINLRNRVTHGLLGPEEFSEAVADLVLHSYLAFSSLRKGSGAVDE